MKVRKVRLLLRKRDGDYCYICHSLMYFNPLCRHSNRYATIDHIIPRVQGGTDDMKNLKLACYECNNYKGNKKTMSRDIQGGFDIDTF